MLPEEQKNQFSEIFNEVGISLDITKDQYQNAIDHYEFVGNWLAVEGSPLVNYFPKIAPQGSFMLGTMIKPVNEEDELDIDLVCQFEGKDPRWTQFDLKRIVGDRLKANGIIEKLIEFPDGRRCWTLKYADSSKFHLDILPSIVDKGYKEIYERVYSAALNDYDSLAVRITDKKEPNYRIAVNPAEWLKSNPFGYGFWFEDKARVSTERIRLMSESVQPVRGFQSNKLPLQRVIQILKRHRDIMFDGDEDKPISIIITTLASLAYRKETNIIEALSNIIERMPLFIEERISPITYQPIKWVPNPVNDHENFADKWAEKPRKQENFYKWLTQAKKDILFATEQKGLPLIQEALMNSFGKREISQAFSNYGERQRILREGGSLKMASSTGILGSIGTTLGNHSFHGKD